MQGGQTMVDPALIGQRVQRIQDAVALKTPDRVPVLPVGDAWTANAAGVRLSDIFKAKEVLGDHLCLLGMYPPASSAWEPPRRCSPTAPVSSAKSGPKASSSDRDAASRRTPGLRT